MFRLFFVALFLFVSVDASAQAWPNKGEFFVKGCERLSGSLQPHFDRTVKDAVKRGEKFHITAKLCLVEVLHVRIELTFRDEGEKKLVRAELYTTYKFTGKETEPGRPQVLMEVLDMRVIEVLPLPSQSAGEKDPKLPKAEKF